MLSPNIWDSEQVMSLSPDLFKIYIYLISQADDDGRMKISCKLFCTRIFPFKNIKSKQMGKWLIELHNKKLIEIYSDNESEYLHHPNWHKYQKINHPTASILPNPSDCTIFPEYSGGLHEDYCNTNVVLREDSSPISLISIDSLNSIDKGKPSTPQPDDKTIISLMKKIIDDWNIVTKQSRNYKSKDVQRLLKARFKDGFTKLEDYKLVHRYIYSTWHGGKWTNQNNGKPSDFYIRPKTIYSGGKVNGYGDGFAEYLEQARQWQKKEIVPVCPNCGQKLVNEIKNNASSCYSCGADIRATK